MNLKIDLTMYPTIASEVNHHLPDIFDAQAMLLVDVEDHDETKVFLEIDGAEVLQSTDSEANAELIAMASLLTILENNLPNVTCEFRGLIAGRYSVLMADISLMPVAQITPQMVEEMREEMPFFGIRTSNVFEYAEQGLAVGSEVLMYDQLGVGTNPDAKHKPSLYEIVMLGKYIAFNQAIPQPCWAIPYAVDDISFGREVTGGLVYRTLKPNVVAENGVFTTDDGTKYDITRSGLVLREFKK